MRVVLSYTIVGNRSYYSSLQRITTGKECYFCLGGLASWFVKDLGQKLAWESSVGIIFVVKEEDVLVKRSDV